MKCPKCAYFGLDDADRCRNCGYEFSLMTDGDPRTPQAGHRPRATPMAPVPTPRPTPGHVRLATPSRERGTPADSLLNRPIDRGVDAGALDLPLFGAEAGAPLPPPQRPLSVRRPGTLTPRARLVRDTPMAGALPLEPEPVGSSSERPAGRPDQARLEGRPALAASATAERRVGAWLVDVSLMGLVDIVTLYFTLRLCGLSPAEWSTLPPWPLALFFLVINGGYVVLLTGWLGQTIGKMALQIEVVADGHASVGIGRAAVRLLGAVLSLAPVGLGFLWAFFGDRRTWHDRLTGTRVVQVTLS